MKREETWMTFAEALEEYLNGRDALNSCHVNHGPMYDNAKEQMDTAAEHLNALISME